MTDCIAPVVRKQLEMYVGVQLAFSFLFSLKLQSIELVLLILPRKNKTTPKIFEPNLKHALIKYWPR